MGPKEAMVEDLEQRKEVARAVLAAGMEELDPLADLAVLEPQATLTADLQIPFPSGLAPVPRPLAAIPDPLGPLPPADVLVITWTVAEQDALADVFTPEWGRRAWYPYARGFEERYAPLIRAGAPSLNPRVRRLGSWFPSAIGGRSVVCFKSELHLNQDGKPTGDGTATLPVKDMLHQLVAEVQPEVVLTVGTSGGVYGEHDLGDVVVTRGAKFRLSDEFRNEAFNQRTYVSEWEIPTRYFADAERLMDGFADRLVEPPFGPPTKRYPLDRLLVAEPPNVPDIKLDGVDMPEFHPILTTDFFEFGTSANKLELEGCAVEMGDAVLGLVCEELPEPPKWAVVRNLSDPQINADLPTGRGKLNMQTLWAVWYYEAFGYWTSVMGALATWAIVAGLARP